MKYFLRGESCLLDGCLKIVNPFSMDIYHFPVDVHSKPAAIYQGRQTDREEEGVSAGQIERETGGEIRAIWMETLLRTAYK